MHFSHLTTSLSLSPPQSYIFPGMTVINRATAPVENTTLLSSQYFLCKGIYIYTMNAVCNIRRVCLSSTNVFVIQLQREYAWNIHYTMTTHVQYLYWTGSLYITCHIRYSICAHIAFAFHRLTER